MIIGIIIIVITAIIGIKVLIAKDEEFFVVTIFGMLITLGITIGVLFIAADITEPIPSAIDVYQNKTTLEITYKDGVPVDSVVVFKD